MIHLFNFSPLTPNKVSAKAEISWKRIDEDGLKLEVYAHHFGGEWKFFSRHRRFDQWQALNQPPLDDWLSLLDAVRRRINRRLLRPEEEQRLINTILEAFPEADLDSDSASSS